MRWKTEQLVDDECFSRWFAWYPVYTDGMTVWLEFVDRRVWWLYDGLEPIKMFQYKLSKESHGDAD